MKAAPLSLLLLLFFALPALAQEKAASVDPVGTFDFETTVNGEPVTGTMRITGSPGSYAGVVASDLTGELPIRSVRVEGQQLTVVAITPDGDVEIRMTFTGDEFTGEWLLGADGATLKGKRRTG